MECQIEVTKARCPCTYELPGCVFSPKVEETYDRSFARFVEVFKDGSGRNN